MNDKCEASISLQQTAPHNSQRTNINCSSKGKCYKLFFCCFKNTHKKRSKEHVISHDPNSDYEYIVEKLVIKRVPFVSFGIPENTVKSRDDDFIDVQHSLAKVDTMYSNTSNTRSLLYYSENLNQNTVSMEIDNKPLKINSNTSMISEKNNEFLISTNYNDKIDELMNIINSLYPDLKRFNRSVKSSCFLNIVSNESTLSKNIEEISPINRFSNEQNENQKQETIKSITKMPHSSLTQKEFRNIKFPTIKSKNKQKIYNTKQATLSNDFQNNYADNCIKPLIVQSNQDLFCSLKNPTKFSEINQLNIENSNIKQIESKLLLSKQALVNEYRALDESITNNQLNIPLRWKIILKLSNGELSYRYNTFQE